MDTHTYPVTRTDAEWRARLTPEQYAVMSPTTLDDGVTLTMSPKS